MTRGADTRKRLVETAGELFRTQGYHGTGLNQVLEESAAPRGSLYFHFPDGKQQLAVEAVTQAGQDVGRGIELLVRSSDDVGEAIGRVIDFLAADLRQSGYERGCPVGTVALDAATSVEPLRLACSEIFDGWLDLIERRLAEAGWEEAQAAEHALVVVSAIEGALLLARARRDVAPLHAVASQLRESLAEAPKRRRKRAQTAKSRRRGDRGSPRA